jgi:hypothetical protein
MASYPVSLDAGINTELTSSRGPRIPGFKASSLYPPDAKERALTWSRLYPFTLQVFFQRWGSGSMLFCSVGDPDPYVFWPSGSASGSVSQKYGSGSFHHQAKLLFCNFLITFFYL